VKQSTGSPSTPAELKTLASYLGRWMLDEHSRFHGIKRIPRDQKEAVLSRALEIVEVACRNKLLRVLNKGGKPVALATIHPSKSPRVPKQQSLFFIYSSRSRASVLPWLKRTMNELAAKAPRYSQIGISQKDEAIVRKVLEQNGFNTRYEILMGDTIIALKSLKSKKSPSRDLDHLGLTLKKIMSVDELKDVMKLQKQISLKSKRHGYFSHTPDQLKKDEDEYRRIISGQMDGKLLGVYRGKKILGLMVTGVHSEASKSERNGGFSFFLHSSIQGLGITKTGYLLLLEYLRDKGIRKFYGGTSQPAIQTLGKIMKRDVQDVIFVKM
jgi:hypothetical protein